MRKRLIILLLFVAYLIVCRAQNGLFVFADRSYTERFNSAVSLYKGERSMEAYDILKKLHKDASDAMVTAKGYGYALTDADFEFSQKVMTSLLQCAYKMNLYREMKAVCNEQCEGINNYLGYYGGVTLDPARRALYYKVLADNNKSYGNLYYLQGAENATYYKNALYHYEYALKCYIMENRSVSSIIAVYEDLAQLAYIQSFYEDAITYLDHAIDYVVRPETSEKESKAGQLKHLYLLRSAKALCMARLGDYDGALKMMDSNVFPGVKAKLGKQIQPEFNRRRAKILMLRHFAERTDIGDADKLYAEYFKAIKDSVANDFMQMTADQREQYWMIQRPFVADCYQLENNDPELLYDVTLYNKGILLQTSRSFDLLLSADEQMELTRLRLHDAELIAQGEESNTAGDYESQLMQRMDSDGRRKKFFSPLNHTWKDVQKALPKDGCAIEFVEYEKGGDMRFGALVLKKQGTPQFVYICNAHLLGNYYPNDGFYSLYELLKSTSGADKNPIYEDSVIWRMIWNRDLVDAIGDSRKVYFSPDGYLHQLAIEFMKPSELADVNFYRLSSTRVLIDGHSPDAKKIKDGAALILGGIVYQSYATAPEEGDRGNDAKAYELIKSKSVSYNYMPGAKEECDSIVNLRNNPSDLYLYSLNATEKAFYENSRNYQLLHISTHGYFGGDKTVYYITNY